MLLAAELGVKKHYGTWLDARMIRATTEAWDDVKASLVSMLPMYALASFLFFVVLFALSRGMKQSKAPLRTAVTLALLTSMAWRYGAVAPPDARLVRSAFAWSELRGGGALSASAELPDAPTAKKRLPHVMLIITESIRAADACGVHGRSCTTQKDIDTEMQDRIGFPAGYSLASYTLVSVATMLEGKVPMSQERPPQLFDYLMHVQGGRVEVAYFGTHAAEVISRQSTAAKIPTFVSLENFHRGSIDDEDLLLSEANDAKLIPLVRDYARAHRDKPTFSVVHFSGTHAPYYVNEDVTPFTPWTHRASWATLAPLHNAYKNAIVMQDRTTAELLRAFKQEHAGEPWVIIYTSDHGEAFGEHNGIHHGQNVYDEQTHVPFWIAQGGDALSAEEAEHLRAYTQQAVTHADVTPTVLDLFGVLDALPWARARAGFQGRSLLRSPRPLGLLPATNCTPLFTCPLANWGVMAEGKKLLAQPWDADWRCVKSPSDVALAEGECAELRAASRGWFATLPDGKANTK